MPQSRLSRYAWLLPPIVLGLLAFLMPVPRHNDTDYRTGLVALAGIYGFFSFIRRSISDVLPDPNGDGYPQSKPRFFDSLMMEALSIVLGIGAILFLLAGCLFDACLMDVLQDENWDIYFTLAGFFGFATLAWEITKKPRVRPFLGAFGVVLATFFFSFAIPDIADHLDLNAWSSDKARIVVEYALFSTAVVIWKSLSSMPGRSTQCAMAATDQKIVPE